MSKEKPPLDEPPDEESSMANWGDRIIQLENDVAVLQDRMPQSVKLRVFWFIYKGLFIAAPIIGGATAIFAEEPWKTPVILIAFLLMAGKSITDFGAKIDLGPRLQRSILIRDQRQGRE